MVARERYLLLAEIARVDEAIADCERLRLDLLALRKAAKTRLLGRDPDRGTQKPVASRD